MLFTSLFKIVLFPCVHISCCYNSYLSLPYKPNNNKEKSSRIGFSKDIVQIFSTRPNKWSIILIETYFFYLFRTDRLSCYVLYTLICPFYRTYNSHSSTEASS